MKTTLPTPYAAAGARRLIVPRLDASPLGGEIDYDELRVLREWRVYERTNPGAVRYVMYELTQRDVNDAEAVHFFKAVRFLRVTRVPRYLRQSGKDPQTIFDQQRDMLAALRQEDVLFVNLIAKAPNLPLIFAYGVQATGSTIEEAQALCDRSYAVLSGQVDGTYQQLEYAPLTMEEAERLARYRSEWGHLAVARGRPMPTGGSMSMGGVLDGNRTDVESAANQLESFLRGMGEHSFMLSLITVPVIPADITRAWRNLTHKLSDIRSDTDGARAISASIGVPIGFGLGHGDSASQSHSAGTSAGEGYTEGVSEGVSSTVSQTDSVSHTEGVTAGVAEGYSEGVTDSVAVSQSVSHGVNHGVSESVSQGVSESASVNQSLSHGASLTEGISVGHSLGETLSRAEALSESVGISHSDTVGQSLSQGHSISESASMSESVGQSVGVSQTVGESVQTSISETGSVSSSDSVSVGETAGSSASSSATSGRTGSFGLSETLSNTLTETINQMFGISDSTSDSVGDSESQTQSKGIGTRLGGFGSDISEAITNAFNRGTGDSDSLSSSFGKSGSLAEAWSQALSKSLSESASISETVGSSHSSTATVGQTVGTSQSVGVSESVGATATHGTTEAVSVSQTAGRSVGVAESLAATQSVAQTQGVSQSVGTSQSVGASQSVAQTQSASQAVGQNTTASAGSAQSVGANQGAARGISAGVSEGVTQGISQGQSVSQSVSRSASFSESASDTVGRSVGVTQGASAGRSAAASVQRGLSDAYLVGMGRQTQMSATGGLVPSVGISISRQTRDEAKRVVGDILEAQMKRYVEGIESGAFLYQMFLQTPDPDTLARAAGLLKSAFWGPGDKARLPQPFHVITDLQLDPEETERILAHARALSTYRKREPEVEYIEPYLYSTYVTPGEMAAFCHPPTAEGLGLLAVHDSMPVFAMPHDRQGRDIHLGYIVNGERARVTDTHFGVDIDEITHTLIAGITGSGKALPLDTPIPTPTGWTTMGELKVGDEVLTPKGLPTRVTFGTGVMENHDCYRITFSDGTEMIADAEHLWKAADRAGRVRRSLRRNKPEPYAAANKADRALIERLESAVASGDLGEDGLTDIIAVIGHENLVRAAVREVGLEPVGAERRLMLQRYGDKEVKKHHLVKLYSVADVYRAVIRKLHDRIAARQPKPEERLVTTEEMAKSVLSEDGARNWAIRTTDALRLPDAELPIDPYVLGVWLGDGNSRDARFTATDPEIIGHVEACGYPVTPNKLAEGKAPLYQIQGLYRALRTGGLLNNKHIPAAYLRASHAQRLELMRGIVDTNGHVGKKGHVAIALTNEKLARDVWELALTLGYKATLREGTTTFNGTRRSKWTILFTTSDRVAKLSRKAELLPTKTDERVQWRYITAITPVESVPVRCIAVEDHEHLFLAGEAMVPTHNTTTVMKLLSEAVQTSRTVRRRVDATDPTSPIVEHEVYAGAVCLDWQRNMRNLAAVVSPDRFRFFSMSKPALGRFRWNLLAVPNGEMSAVEWANTVADLFMISYGLGEFARSIIWEHINELYSANRLEDFELMAPLVDEETGAQIRPGVVLPALNREDLPEGAIAVDTNGNEYANVYTCPELSRLIGVGELALSVSGRIESLGTQEAGRMFGTDIRNRYQTIWRRLQYFAPGGPLAQMFTKDPSLEVKHCLQVEDLIDPARGLVTVIEADGLDMGNRRLVLGSIMMSIWRYGQTKGEGTFNLDGQGPGTFLVMEEAHELFGEMGEGEDRQSAATRTAIYESMFRRARALGLKLVAVCQNVGDIPAAIYSNTNTVFLHRLYDQKDRLVAASLMNWESRIDHRREMRYLGELPAGWCIARLEPRKHFLEAAPVHFLVDPTDLADVSDVDLLTLAEERAAQAA